MCVHGSRQRRTSVVAAVVVVEVLRDVLIHVVFLVVAKQAMRSHIHRASDNGSSC
jgi:hypothetical protein